MMQVDGRRLVRALAFGLAVFLFVGGGIGFVVAAGQRADDAKTITVPAPRPGDRAVYAVKQSIVDPRVAKGDLDYFREATYEWMPERWDTDGQFQMRLVHPLRYTFLWAADTKYEHRYVREATYDAYTGEPVSETEVWDGEVAAYQGTFGSVSPGPDAERHTRFDGYTGQVGACGFSLPFAGRPYDGKNYAIRGNCDWPGGLDAFTFKGDGWQDSPRGRVYQFRALEDTRFGYRYDETSPFPAWATAVLSESITAEYTLGRYFVLTRVSSEQGTGSYTPLVASAVQPSEPVQDEPRTPWGLDDSGVDHRFPLSKAYAAVMAQQPIDPRCPQCEHVLLPDWLASHPGAYLAYASTATYSDRFGTSYLQWNLIWTDGVARLGKQVQYGPDGVRSFILPQQTGDSIRIYDWNGAGFPYPDHGLVPPAQVPDHLPKVLDLLARYEALTGLKADKYGFGILCENDGCTKVLTVVTAGRNVRDLADPLTQPVDDAIRPYDAVYDGLQTDEDGNLRLRWMDVVSQESVFPPLLPQDQAPPAHPSNGAAVTGAWVFPSAPAAATGISLFAILVAALYYFWPALKGAALTPLFSRIQDDDLLDHPVRARILEAVRAEPGLHFQEMARRVGIGRSSLEHHLRKLVEAELVTVRRTPGYTCYFPKGAVDRRVMDAAPLLRSGGGRAVLDAVGQRPGVSSRDLAQHLGLAPSTVSYHLKRFEAAGLILPGAKAGARLTTLGEQAAA